VWLSFYELANRSHNMVYIDGKNRTKSLDTLPYILMYGKLLKGFRAVLVSVDTTLDDFPEPPINEMGLGSF
jgi:hypothetical protein